MPTDLDAPRTIEDGKVPDTRISDARATQNRVKRLCEADAVRSKRRALVKGLVDGNPPYKASDLRNAGRAYQCNVNWRIAESYLGQAIGAFYDVFSETPTYATVEICTGTPDEQATWSGVVTEEFQKLQKADKSWDYTIQRSQEDMVLYGNGPIWFNDEVDWRCEAGMHADLKVPEFAKSDPGKWEEAARLSSYLPHELYSFIRNEQAATQRGWSVSAVKKAIMQAHPKTRDGGEYSNWDWHQQRLKNQAFEYSAESSTVECGHYFVREFPTSTHSEGAITHVICLRAETGENSETGYLFKKASRYENWQQLIHPMYYANDGGGYHHSVTGMGVKMYSAMEYQNRLLCNLADKTFAAKLLFKPTSPQVEQALNLVQFGDYAKLPAGFDYVQIPTQSFIEDGVVFNREISRLVASNLSQYRQESRKEDGNPQTATQIVHDAQQQAKLGKTQLNRYYQQLDWLYAEKFRRAASSKVNSELPGGKEAKEFQEKCMERGVPRKAFEYAKVHATRITGQGSEFMRQQSLSSMLGLLPMLPETGRDHLLQDYIAAFSGQNLVTRYFPTPVRDQKPNDHTVTARLQVAAMKEGVAPVVTGDQNHIIFAQEFLQAAAKGIEAAATGQANPVEAIAFVEIAGPAIMQHIDMARQDESRKQVVEVLEDQWKQLAKNTDDLRTQLEKAVQRQGEKRESAARAQAMAAGQDPELQMKQMETNAKLQMSQQKTDVSLRQKEEKHRQAMAINDATTAHQIQLDREAAEAKKENQSKSE